ncbi:NAD(P)H-dependent flavin oxidoreductase [Salinisphaera aquimarina]|uniref:Propionate 3-nitronate monooxygenase n=1 Tax=Salinisphaera aquimarina TaxID=2094031 RepID=A0ABV7ERW0_9GAMM
MKIPSRCTKSLGIETPIIQAPMAGGTTTPELVAEVSNAGGLGSLGAGYMAPAALDDAIDDIRSLTERPFAVNLFVPRPPTEDAERVERSNTRLDIFRGELGIERPVPPERYAPSFEAQFEAVVMARVPVFSFTFGALDVTQVERLKDAGSGVIGTATTVAEAVALEKTGVDMIVAQGSDAGGHRGTFLHPFEQALIGTMSLVPQVADAVTVPVIASGGIMDGRGVAAAFMLGASAVQMGSAFLLCQESGANPAHQRALLDEGAVDTTVTRAFSGKPARGIRNRFITDMADLESTLPDYPIQNAWTKDVRAAASKQRQPEFMSLWAGQAARLGRQTTARQLVADIRDYLRSV